MKRLTIVGSTGSIGQNTLRVVEHLSDRLRVFALAANSTVDLLAEQTAAFKPNVVAITDPTRVDAFRNFCRKRGVPVPEVVTGEQGLRQIVRRDDVDIIINALVGFAGLKPTIEAIKQRKNIALANKESLVVAGNIVTSLAKEHGVSLLPIDSEHSAILQCLSGEMWSRIYKIILTASGGPFLNVSKGGIRLHYRGTSPQSSQLENGK